MPHISLHTPIGDLTIFEGPDPAGRPAILAIEWGRGAESGEPPTPLLRAAAAQLQDYFDGQRLAFDLPLSPQGTVFRRQVWQALCRIPPGETRSYLDIAREIGCRSPRAIGQANGANPIPILIPCHRVVAAGGGLGGYSGGDGAATKRYLLALEARVRARTTGAGLPLFPPPPGGSLQGSIP